MALHCPFCKSDRIQRIPRLAWMRRVPFSRYYECEECLASFMTMLGIIVWRRVWV